MTSHGNSLTVSGNQNAATPITDAIERNHGEMPGAMRRMEKSLSQAMGSRGAISHCVMKAALVRMDECRAKCPGSGGDIDAMNLRHMIQAGPIPSAITQAADRLASLSDALDINAEMEVAALREISTY